MSANYRNPNWLLPNELNQSINPSLSESRKSLYSMNFDGTSDHIDLETVNFGVNSTLSFWCFYTSNNSVVFGDGIGYNYYIYFLGTDVYFRTGSTLWSSVLTKNVWQHLCFVRNGDSVELFINNVSQGVRTGAGTTNQSSITSIGAKPTGAYRFAGKIDEVAMWNKALSDTEVAALATANAPANLMALSAKPFAYYPLGEFAGNSGELGGTPSGQTNSWKFPNQAIKDYVFDFDGTDEIEIPETTLSGEFSISVWINPDTFTASQSMLFGGNSSNAYKIEFNGPTIINIKIAGSNTGVYSSTSWTLNKWQHLLITRNSSNLVTIYRNGVSWGTTTKSGDFIFDMISGFNNSASHFDGRLSNIAIWNSDQTSEKDNIYNNGSPATSYTNTPTSWWKLNAATSSYNHATSTWTITDSAGSNNGTSTTLPSTSLIPSDLQFESPYSNFSLDFDGAGNSVNCTNDSVLDITGSITLSCWMKSSNTGANRKLLTKDDGSTRSFQINTNHASIGPYTYFWLGGGTIKSVSTGTPNQIVDGNWHHVVSVFKSGEYIRMYIDGVQAGNTGVTETTLDSSTANFLIGSNGWSGTVGIDGNVDEVAVWSSALTDAQVNQVYNNGRPGDLSSLSPVSWWRLGEDAFFVNNNITIPNQISGGPTGTGSGTQTAMLSADAPQSYGGGYGVGLAVTDKIGDAPESTANSLSYNMIPDNRHPYIPGYAPAKVDNNFSMSFNGVNDYFSAPISALNSSTVCSISFWGKKDSSGVDLNVGGYISNSQGIWIQWFLDGNIYFSPRGTGGSSFGLAHAQTYDNNWHHYVGVYDGTSASNCKLYLDGNLVATGTGTPPSSLPATTGDVFQIGALGTASYTDGNIDEVAIFDYALTAKQIKEDIYNASTTGKTADLSNNSNLTAPVAWYRMGD